MLPLPVTICITAIFVLMLTILSLTVSVRRAQLNVPSGDGDDITLRRRIRAHGNFVENAPLCVLLILAIEAILATSDIIWIVAAILITSRILHAIGTLKRAKRVVAPAMVMQHLTLGICGVWLLIQTFGNLVASSS
ncbi:MAPEG family protein [Thalassospira sp.]|uniref:MAPEG family protein n=1 Tax=Thalassospira sp. TaxID=1912094 RepID=UPI003AA9BF7C